MPSWLCGLAAACCCTDRRQPSFAFSHYRVTARQLLLLAGLSPSMGRRGFLAMTSATPRRRSSLTRFLKAAGKRVVVGHVNVLISYTIQPASKQSKAICSGPHDGDNRVWGSGAAGPSSSGCCAEPCCAERELSSPCPTWPHSCFVVALVEGDGAKSTRVQAVAVEGTWVGWLGSALADLSLL